VKKLVILGIDHGHCQAIINASAERNDVELVAIAQETAPFANEMAANLGVKEYRDYRECLTIEAPDIVGVAMYNGARAKWITESLSRNIAVISDKPICTTKEGLADIRAAQAATDTPLCMMLTERCNASFVAIRKAVQDGRIGKVVGVEATRYYALNPANRPWWMFKTKAYGGPAVDILIHDYDLARWITGREWNSPTISQYRITKDYNIDDGATLVSDEDGVAIRLGMYWQSPCGHHSRFTVYGTKGYVELNTAFGNSPILIDDKGNRTDLPCSDVSSFASLFFAGLAGEECFPITAVESMEVMANLL